MNYPSVSRVFIQHGLELYEYLKESTLLVKDHKSYITRLISPWLANVTLTPENMAEKGIFRSLSTMTLTHLGTPDIDLTWLYLASKAHSSQGLTNQPNNDNIQYILTYLQAIMMSEQEHTDLIISILGKIYSVHPKPCLTLIAAQLSHQGFDKHLTPTVFFVSLSSISFLLEIIIMIIKCFS